MVVVMVAVTLAIACFFDLISLYKNFDNPKFRDNLIRQAIIKMGAVTLLLFFIYSMR